MSDLDIKIRKLIDLIHLAELDWNVCQTLYFDKIDKTKPQKYSLNRLIANNAFDEAVSIVHTLLAGSDKRELCIGPILKQYNISKMAELDQILQKFKKHGFIKVRNQLVGHKNELLSNPAGNANLLLKDEYIEFMGGVICELRDNMCVWFEYARDNPSLMISEEINNLTKEA